MSDGISLGERSPFLVLTVQPSTTDVVPRSIYSYPRVARPVLPHRRPAYPGRLRRPDLAQRAALHFRLDPGRDPCVLDDQSRTQAG